MSYPTKKPHGRSSGWSQPRADLQPRPSVRLNTNGTAEDVWLEPVATDQGSTDQGSTDHSSTDQGSSEQVSSASAERFVEDVGGLGPRAEIQDMIAQRGSVKSGLQGMIDTNPVLVIATSTCPFCVEAKRALAGHGITDQFVYIDQEPNTAEIRKAMTALAANRTSVPQIWINQKHVGGCDDLKALDKTGDLGVALEGIPRPAPAFDIESGPGPEKSPADVDAAVSTYPGPTAAYFPMFHAPISVDNRAVRLGGSLTSIYAAACVVFAERYVTSWVVLGMFVSKTLDMTGLPGPYALLVKLPFAGTKPRLQADTLYAWDEANLRTGKDVAPESITYRTKGLPPNPTDLRARPYDSKDKWQQFHIIKYVHITLFMAPLAILGLALPWAKLHDTVGTSPLVWQVLAWTGVALQAVLGTLYFTKCALYPKKVRKEWCHPIKHNMFAVPFISFIIMSFLATRWSSVSGDLARALFWIGSAPLNALALYTVASWIAIRRDQEFVNPTWILMPVGNLVGAMAARAVDGDYAEWGWYLFGVGALLWLALWPITFLMSIDNHHSDPNRRNFYGIWVAPPAVAMMAYANLSGLSSIDNVQRILFYASLSMAMVLAMSTWPLNFFVGGKFDMSLFAFAFPLDVLASAAITVYGYTQTDTMQVISIVAITVASMVNAVNVLLLLGAVKGKHVFTPEAKFSPMSFTKLTHEAFREALPRLEKLAAQVKPGAAGASKLREVASAWEAISKAHDVHSRHEDEVIFPTLETYFPGQTSTVGDDHKEHEELIHAVQSGLNSLLGSDGLGKKTEAVSANLLEELKANIRKFGKEVREHMDNEEHFYSTPVTRKFLNVTIAKDLARRSWDVTPNPEMSEFLRWVMSSLRIRGQRTKFLKTWVWAMPERAQLVGLMVYRVVDDVTWVQLAYDLPEIVPRGLPGYSRSF
ncbi:Glutaredoxin glutaredoxin/malate transporter fusion protein [Ectocarpus siliculosus]|uniref:Glutaredoxin glutaredoxin/malate transporter fusion protein n=1 Tax=Ectocarpus siliculosus TaxID=2880 RepID=D7G375_ECTSI|nr:Glutaredoxin glutaredoxin/malate transporter fusion protein [Ectocarpus siliculosus]|eukprot:CBJ26922.1 Glutaredoxin glutaredoxin/malate transporter fusion protein [Ectocarpus siliculosus]